MNTIQDWTTLKLPPIAADEDELLALEALIANHGDCHIQRFDRAYPSLEAFLTERTLPLRHLEFVSTELSLSINQRGVTLRYAPGAADLAKAVERALITLELAPITRYFAVACVLLLTGFFMAVWRGAYYVLPLIAVLFMLVEHTALDNRARRSILKVAFDVRKDPRAGMGIGLAVLVISAALARLLAVAFAPGT